MFGLDWDKVEDLALQNTGVTHYSYLDALILGVEKFFGVSLTSKTHGEVCSEFAARILAAGGIPVRHDIDPNELYKFVSDYQTDLPIRINF